MSLGHVHGIGYTARRRLTFGLEAGQVGKALYWDIMQWIVGATCSGACSLHRIELPGQGCLAKSMGSGCTTRNEDDLDAFGRENGVSGGI